MYKKANSMYEVSDFFGKLTQNDTFMKKLQTLTKQYLWKTLIKGLSTEYQIYKKSEQTATGFQWLMSWVEFNQIKLSPWPVSVKTYLLWKTMHYGFSSAYYCY